MRTCKLHGCAEGVQSAAGRAHGYTRDCAYSTHYSAHREGCTYSTHYAHREGCFYSTHYAHYSTHYAHREVAHIGERNELARAPAVYLVEVDVLAHLALC